MIKTEKLCEEFNKKYKKKENEVISTFNFNNIKTIEMSVNGTPRQIAEIIYYYNRYRREDIHPSSVIKNE